MESECQPVTLTIPSSLRLLSIARAFVDAACKAAGLDEATHAAERMCASVSEAPIMIEHTELVVTLSGGCAADSLGNVDARLAVARASSAVANLVLAGDDLRATWAASPPNVRGKVINALMTVTVLAGS